MVAINESKQHELTKTVYFNMAARLLFLASLVLAGVFCKDIEIDHSNEVKGKIINGNDAKRYQFRFMVSIQKHDRHICGGAIISKLWIVTAAHCACPKEASELTVYAGLLHQGEYHSDMQKVPVQDFIRHPQYEPSENFPNDIALIKLMFRLRYNEAIDSISLPDVSNGVTLTNIGYTVGWGKIRGNPSLYPSALQYFQGYVLNFKECQDMLNQNNVDLQLKETNNCIYSSNHNICEGDSGSPLVQEGVLVGIVSMADMQCNVGLPGIYTKISSYTDFITDIIES